MSDLVPLDLDMIATCLRLEHGGVHINDTPPYCRVRFFPTEYIPCEMSLVGAIDGEERIILRLNAYTNVKIAEAQWGEAISRCNVWNASTRWPKAYRYREEHDQGVTGQIILDQQYFLRDGITPEQFRGLYRVIYEGACDFWVEHTKYFPISEDKQ